MNMMRKRRLAYRYVPIGDDSRSCLAWLLQQEERRSMRHEAHHMMVHLRVEVRAF